jgi:hypothetical protein
VGDALRSKLGVPLLFLNVGSEDEEGNDDEVGDDKKSLLCGEGDERSKLGEARFMVILINIVHIMYFFI